MKLAILRSAASFGLHLGSYHILPTQSRRLPNGQLIQKPPLDFGSRVFIVNNGERLAHPKTASSRSCGLLEHCYCSILWQNVCTPVFVFGLF